MGETEDGKPYVQRFAFTTLYSDAIRTLVRDSRFEPIRTLVDEGARIGERENGGVVVNRYVNRKKEYLQSTRLAYRRTQRRLQRSYASRDAQRGAAP